MDMQSTLMLCKEKLIFLETCNINIEVKIKFQTQSYFTKASSKLGQFTFCLGDILHDQTRVSHREKEGLVAQYFYWIVIWWERFLIFRHFIVCNLYQAGAWYTVAAWLCMGG